MTSHAHGPARLALAEGSIFYGRAFGATGRGIVSEAEVVFNTAMTGYQESLSDPSYRAQILVQTTPLVGNTGVNDEDLESSTVQVAGLVVHELARRHSNYRATRDLGSFLGSCGVLGMTGADTRSITRILRTRGSTPGVLTDDPGLSDAALVERARRGAVMDGRNLVPEVGCDTPRDWNEALGKWGDGAPAVSSEHPTVLAMDCGAKSNILRHLVARGCRVRLIPHDTPAAVIRAEHESGRAHGLFVSNGPGDPAAVESTVSTLRELIGAGPGCIPTFGICLGHQMLALAIGARTYKLKFGHRGANQPVRSALTGHVEITSQNHGFAVDADSLEPLGGEATHIHLNDGTLAGFRLKDRPVFAVQYHPEASPGPHDAGGLFDLFVEMIRTGQPPVLTPGASPV